MFQFNFSKVIRDFSHENNCKTDLKFCAPWLAVEENFEKHEIVLNNKQLCKKSSERKLCGISHRHGKGPSLLL